MTNAPGTEPETADRSADEGVVRRGFFSEWVAPIVLGLAIGGGLVWVWGAMKSRAEKIVAEWNENDTDTQDRLAAEMRALGRDAREDVLAVFRDLKVRNTPEHYADGELKLWVAQILAREPFLDTRSLIDVARDGTAPVWDRRIAAAALVDVLGKDVDPEAVVDVLLAWLEDAAALDHGMPTGRIRTLQSHKIFPPDRDARLKKAMVELAQKSRTGVQGRSELEEGLIDADRTSAIFGLAARAKDPEVQAFLWSVVLDEKDQIGPRVAAVRVLGEQVIFDDVAKWKLAASVESDTVRQAAGENLYRSKEPVFDDVLTKQHADRAELVRSGSLLSQGYRRRPTMLPIFAQLIEDHASSVRREAIHLCATFKDHSEGANLRLGALLHVLATTDDDDELGSAFAVLARIAGKSFGVAASDIDQRSLSVDDAALAAFKADTAGRVAAVEAWSRHFGGQAVYGTADRRAALTALLGHADPLNVARAKSELAKLPPE